MCQKARDFAFSLRIPDTDFNCSVGWLERFKARHGITFKKISGEANSVSGDDESVLDWQNCPSLLIKAYSQQDIFNADKTAIFYRAMPDRTLKKWVFWKH